MNKTYDIVSETLKRADAIKAVKQGILFAGGAAGAGAASKAGSDMWDVVTGQKKKAKKSKKTSEKK